MWGGVFQITWYFPHIYIAAHKYTGNCIFMRRFA